MADKSNKLTKKEFFLPGHGPQFYGSAVVGERGQIVIPKEARKDLNLKAGDKLIVFGVPGGKLMLAKGEELREFAKQLLQSIE